MERLNMIRTRGKHIKIDVGFYIWNKGIPIPKCDSCEIHDAQFKVYVPNKIGIRLCGECLDYLEERLKKTK